MKPSRDFSWPIIVLLAFFYVANASATNYYVSNNGNDNAAGTTPGTAWKTIAKLNTSNFTAGDSILFQRGNTWRAKELQISNSGSKNKHIVYGAYGSGARPEILGSFEVTTWSNVAGNIWKSGSQVPVNPWDIGYDGPEIFFENNQDVYWGQHQSYTSGFTNLTSEYHWTWYNNNIYIYAPSNPATRYSAVEVPQTEKLITLMDKNYITITALALKYCADAAIYDQYATIELYGLNVTYCEIAYVGKKNGGAAYGLSVHRSNARYAHNEIHNCGRRGISLTLYNTNPISQSNVIIEHNHFHHGWHTTSLDCSIGADHAVDSIIFRNNLVEGDPNVDLGENPNSNHIFIDNQSSSGGKIENFYFYNNIFTYAHGSSIKIGDVEQVYVYNNTFYYFNPTLDNWQAHVFSHKTKNIEIFNNIFCNNAQTNRWAAIETNVDAVDYIDIDYNLYYNDDPGRRMLWIDAGTSYDVEQWAAYRSATGKDVHSPAPANPQFANAGSNFHLTKGSPAIGAGKKVPWIHTDFYGNGINTPPDLGAIQYKSNSGSDIADNAMPNTLNIFPNPASTHCHAVLNKSFGQVVKLTVYNLQGKMVLSELVEVSHHQCPIPASTLANGLYLVDISNKSGHHNTGKLLVNR